MEWLRSRGQSRLSAFPPRLLTVDAGMAQTAGTGKPGAFWTAPSLCGLHVFPAVLKLQEARLLTWWLRDPTDLVLREPHGSHIAFGKLAVEVRGH